jgi:uncharacterized protein (TIGR03435 family)
MILAAALDVPLSMVPYKFAWAAHVQSMRYAPMFEIHAKGDPANDSRAMLRTLLLERFGLKTRTELRPMPVSVLVVKEPGMLGPWLKPSSINCRALARTKFEAGRPSQCSVSRDMRNGARVQRDAGTIRELVGIAQSYSMRPVIDATGLAGDYEWELAFALGVGTREDAENIMREAFEDQLGLKLERRTAPYEVVVIDNVQMPTPN